MKNIHVLPTENSSRLSYNKDGVLELHRLQWRKNTQNIYITSNSKFVRDEYITDGIEVIKATPKLVDAQGLVDRRNWNKIIITTDQELIKDGVHSIGEEFLKWFVENPTCTKVEVVYGLFNPMGRQVDPNDLGQNHSKCVWKYKIITTKEEPKFENSIENSVNIMSIANSMFGGKQEPKLQCKDCNDNLTDCTCIEDTVDMKQETMEYDLLQHIKFCLECDNESQAIRLLEKYGFEKQEEGYSEQDMKSSFQVGFNVGYNDEESPSYLTFEEWIKEYKKK